MRIHDGAYGSLLAQHLHGDETVDDLSVRDPIRVLDAHRAYLDAGATAIQSNAFLAYLRTSSRRRRELQRAALECAREAASTAQAPDVITVIATIGPAGEEPRDFWTDLDDLLGWDARAVQCETVTDRRVAEAFLAAWVDVAAGVDAEVSLGCSVHPDQGIDASRWVLEVAAEAPPEVRIGLNCCAGPDGLRPLIEELCELRGSVWIMPSAGIPTSNEQPPEWPLGDPARWVDRIAAAVESLPVDAIGGCCGTAQAHIEALTIWAAGATPK